MRRRRKKCRPLRLLFLLLIVGLIVAGVAWACHALLPSNGPALPASGEPAEIVEPEVPSLPDETIHGQVNLHSSNAILVRLEDGAVLFSRGADQRVYPASLTKIMTALVALEQLDDLDQKIIVPEKIFEELYESSASVAGFEPGEKVRAVDLIAGVLLPSGGDASLTLATELAGSEKAFVALMNQRAEELGMKNTHFTNACGLHNEQHYSSARDMQILLAEALKNADFRKIFIRAKYVVPATNKHPEGFTMFSTMFRGMEKTEFPGGKILGGKTGTTTPAGQCLASLAEKNGREYLLVTMGAHTEEKILLSGEDALTLYSLIGETESEDLEQKNAA